MLPLTVPPEAQYFLARVHNSVRFVVSGLEKDTMVMARPHFRRSKLTVIRCLSKSRSLQEHANIGRPHFGQMSVSEIV
ncbi:MAG: hypothetical protein Kow0069_01910 [Promethearchaeota archaeon]